MNSASLQVQMKSLEIQLDVLRAQLSAETDPEIPALVFADLYGTLADKSDFAEEDIRAAEYDVEWDSES